MTSSSKWIQKAKEVSSRSSTVNIQLSHIIHTICIYSKKITLIQEKHKCCMYRYLPSTTRSLLLLNGFILWNQKFRILEVVAPFTTTVPLGLGSKELISVASKGIECKSTMWVRHQRRSRAHAAQMLFKSHATFQQLGLQCDSVRRFESSTYLMKILLCNCVLFIQGVWEAGLGSRQYYTLTLTYLLQNQSRQYICIYREEIPLGYISVFFSLIEARARDNNIEVR